MLYRYLLTSVRNFVSCVSPALLSLDPAAIFTIPIFPPPFRVFRVKLKVMSVPIFNDIHSTTRH